MFLIKVYGIQAQQKSVKIAEKEECVDHAFIFPNPGVPCWKPVGGSKVDSACHPSEVDKVSNRNFWELRGKK